MPVWDNAHCRLNQFTGTIWLLLIFNILAFYLVVVHIREPSDMEGEEEDKPGYYNVIVSKCLNNALKFLMLH